MAIKKTLLVSCLIAGFIIALFCYLVGDNRRFRIERAHSRRSGAPYEPSSMITSVLWDFSTLMRSAYGSDLWPVTWADDDALYTAWGDGGGFGGTNSRGRVKLGVARIRNGPDRFQGQNIFGGFNCLVDAWFTGKPTGIICINRILYMGIVEQDKWLRWKIGRSEDHGKTWLFNGKSFEKHWDFAEKDGAFNDVCFLQFGRNYRGARDEFVYCYSQDYRAKKDRKHIAMFRVRKDEIMNRKAYEYFAGVDQNGKPVWTKDINKRKPVFTDPNGVGWGVRVVYNPGLKRYLLTTWHKWDGSWGIFDAPEPWGPWTTVAYYDQWIDDIPKFGFAFPQKWMSPDGRTMWMIFSGTGKYDCFNVIKCVLKTAKSSN